MWKRHYTQAYVELLSVMSGVVRLMDEQEGKHHSIMLSLNMSNF